MSWFRLAVNMDNAAFEDPGTELARLLHQLADEIDEEGMSHFGPILDINGNTVGTYEVRT